MSYKSGIGYIRPIGDGITSTRWHDAHVAAKILGGSAPATQTPRGGITFSQASASLCAFPCIFNSGIVDGIAFVILTGSNAGTKTRVGIYSSISSTDMYPGFLVATGSEFAADVSGTAITTGLSASLDPTKLYWIAYLNNTNGTGRIYGTQVSGTEAGAASSFVWAAPLGVTSTDFKVSYPNAIQVSQSYGSLPATFPTGGTFAVLPVYNTFLRFSA